MKTNKAPKHLQSNTGYRFISEGKTAYKIAIPKPLGGTQHKSVGFKKLGKKEALQKALVERNRLGKELWRGFWHRVVSDWTLLMRLPRSLEPHERKASDKKSLTIEFVANWNSRNADGEVIKNSRRYSTSEHGRLGAYSKAKQALLTAHEANMPLLVFMERAPKIKLK